VSGFRTPEISSSFVYDETKDEFRCPVGEALVFLLCQRKVAGLCVVAGVPAGRTTCETQAATTRRLPCAVLLAPPPRNARLDDRKREAQQSLRATELAGLQGHSDSLVGERAKRGPPALSLGSDR